MEATFLTTLASHAERQPNFVVATIVGVIVAVLVGGLVLLDGGPGGFGLVIAFGLGTLGFGVTCLPSVFQADSDPTPTDVVATALTTYLADAHDLTVTGPITLTTTDPRHTDITHAPGRAEALAENAAGDLVDVTVTWNDPSMDPDDNLVTVITAAVK